MWEKEFNITDPAAKAEILVSGPNQVGFPHKIFVIIIEPTTKTGKLTVEVLKPDDTPVETLADEVNIEVTGGKAWIGTYTWTPTEKGSYKIKVTFTVT